MLPAAGGVDVSGARRRDRARGRHRRIACGRVDPDGEHGRSRQRRAAQPFRRGARAARGPEGDGRVLGGRDDSSSPPRRPPLRRVGGRRRPKRARSRSRAAAARRRLERDLRMGWRRLGPCPASASPAARQPLWAVWGPPPASCGAPARRRSPGRPGALRCVAVGGGSGSAASRAQGCARERRPPPRLTDRAAIGDQAMLSNKRRVYLSASLTSQPETGGSGGAPAPCLDRSRPMRTAGKRMPTRDSRLERARAADETGVMSPYPTDVSVTKL